MITKMLKNTDLHRTVTAKAIVHQIFLFFIVDNIYYFTIKRFLAWVMCSSHASATTTCEQSRPKQEGKDQASNTYK